MFRKSPDDDYEALSEGGVRYLFRLGPYEFHDTLDDEGRFHHFVLEGEREGAEGQAYEVDTEFMYELMARFLAGEYEKAEYRLERSPGHETLLDLLEIATARARAGDHAFSLEDLEHEETEVFDDDEELEDEEREEDSRA
ncbi:MAG TPA: hypothetical protein VHG91_11550 [Longimicrobium sp.]|nr:hypothetical protein [Longimicrobium sp.]